MVGLSTVYDIPGLRGKCITQFQLRQGPFTHPPPHFPGLLRGICLAFAWFVSPGGGAFANFALPWGQASAYPRAIPKLLTRMWFPIRI